MQKRIIFSLLTLLVISGCNNNSASTSTGSHGDNPSVSTPPSSEEEEPYDTSYITSEEPFDSPDVLPADMSLFKNAVVSDPVILYSEDDYLVRPYPNGFTYPLEAQVQPTNAYLEFWHPETNLDIQIIASTEVFQLIENNGFHDKKYADVYFPVSVKVLMNRKYFIYHEVGMRMKGNTSRRDFIDDNGNFTTPTSFKLSFNEHFTEDIYDTFNLKKTWSKATHKDAWDTRDDRTFMGLASGKGGLKKLDFKWNKSEDSSLIMQPFVFSFFQKHGIISQNSTLSTLKFNGTRMGIVTINEPINKHLFRRYLNKSGAAGELYKVGWSSVGMGSLRIEDYEAQNNIVGIEDKFIGYEPGYDMKEGDGTHALLLNLMQKLKDVEGKSVSAYKNFLEEVVDMDSFLTYAALSYLTGNPDDMRNNGNNYYIYFNPNENNKAYFIPYDYDWSLNLTWDMDGVRMEGVPPYHTKHQGNGRTWQKNRLYWLSILNETSENRDPHYNISLNSEYQRTYLEKLHAFNDSYYSEYNYNVLYYTYRRTYNYKSGSDFDNGGKALSPFAGTTIMVDFINAVQGHLNKTPL